MLLEKFNEVKSMFFLLARISSSSRQHRTRVLLSCGNDFLEMVVLHFLVALLLAERQLAEVPVALN